MSCKEEKTFLGIFLAACVSELYILMQTDRIFCIGEVKPLFLKNLRIVSNYRWLYQLITPGCPGVQVSTMATCFQPRCLCEAQMWCFGTAVLSLALHVQNGGTKTWKQLSPWLCQSPSLSI